MPRESAGEPETVLRLAGITRRFGALTANDAISLDLKRGEIMGLLGENGAGKTTLVNILFGHYVADEGSIDVFGKPLPPGSPGAAIAAGVGMVHQHFALAENLSVLDNIMLGTESLWRLRSRRDAARARVIAMGTAFGLAVDPEAIVATLSVGERQRVEILKALYRNARILILDEPTAVLTPQESARLFETLKRFTARGLSVILISHKLDEVLAACSRVLVLRGGRLVAERPSAAVTRAELAELMVGRSIPAAKAAARAPGKAVFAFKTVSARHGARSLTDVSFTIREGEILGIAGVSGNGQSLLADLAAGMARPASGHIAVRGLPVVRGTPGLMMAAGVGRIPEDRHAEGLIADMSVAENVIAERIRAPQFSHHGFINWKAARDFAQSVIAAYEVKCPSTDAPARLLSGGNMQKLILGRAMDGLPAVVLANQPTRGLDVGAVAYVHTQLLKARARGAAILLISEDLDELLALSDRVAVMHQGRLTEAVARQEVTIRALGLMMTGGEAHAA